MQETKPIRILIAEDHQPTTTLLTMFLEKHGHIIYTAENGVEALALYHSNKPDLVLTDVNMPLKNGLDLIKDIRAEQKELWVPIIILSANGDDDSIIQGLECGADDYLAKPINLSILQAKVSSMYRIVDLQWLNQQARIQLAESNQKLEHEQVLAKKLADSILEMGDLDTADVDYWLCPASIFSGDLIAVQHADDGKLYVILADSSGHGLASSLPTLTTAKVFHSMLERGFTLQKTLSEMNAEVNRFLPIDRFMAAAVFAIDYQHQLIECWNGGLPPVLLVNQQGDVVHQFKSEHLAMSILNKKEFDAATEIYKWQEPLELFAYSDGLIEATDSNNIAFGEQALFKLLKNAPVDGRVEYIKDNVLDYIQTSYAKDDISLLLVNCPITNE